MTPNGQYHNFVDWEATAKQRGYAVDHDGSGKLVAHVDGEEYGTWDPKYGGCGYGWFHQEKM